MFQLKDGSVSTERRKRFLPFFIASRSTHSLFHPFVFKKAMKKIGFVLLIASLLPGCGSFSPEDENDSSKQYAITLTPRFPEDTEVSPSLTLFICNQDKQTIDQQEINSSNPPISISLPGNNYRLTLCSGLSKECYVVNQNRLCHKTNHYSTQPLMLGSADIHPSKNSNINLSLKPCVASLNFSFTGLPPHTEKVTLQLSPVSSSVSLNGEYANDNQTCSLTCLPGNQVWTSETVYVFPEEESTRTRLSIEVHHDGKNEVYSYTYKHPLTAGQPYHFSGSLGESSFVPDTDFEIDGWKPGVEIEFDLSQSLGGGKEEQLPEDRPSYDNLETVYSPSLPESECIWGKFYVWKVDTVTTNEEVIATLISPYQWYLQVDEALPALANYQVDGFRGWSIFSSQEAKAFRNQYRKNLYDLNEFIESNGYDGFKKEGRYLCSQADSTFSFSNNRIIKAGDTPNYYLRGIKKIRVIQK